MDIDLNSDLGEGFGPYRMGEDEALMELISSANVACGYHAGDPVIMDKTVRLALAKGIDIGAHVSFPDRMGFGRRPMQIDPVELEKHVLYQAGALYGIAAAAGHAITNVSFHGALGNMSFVDRDLAEALVRAVVAFDRTVTLSVLANTEIERAGQRAGLRTVARFLADRAYDDQGLLVSRKIAGALIKDTAAIKQRVRQLLDEGTVTTISGKTIRMAAPSILVHSDTPGAVALARTIRDVIESGNGRIVPLSRLVS